MIRQTPEKQWPWQRHRALQLVQGGVCLLALLRTEILPNTKMHNYMFKHVYSLFFLEMYIL